MEAVVDWRRRSAELCGGAVPAFLWEGRNALVSLAEAEDLEQLLAARPGARGATGAICRKISLVFESVDWCLRLSLCSLKIKSVLEKSTSPTAFECV